MSEAGKPESANKTYASSNPIAGNFGNARSRTGRRLRLISVAIAGVAIVGGFWQVGRWNCRQHFQNGEEDKFVGLGVTIEIRPAAFPLFVMRDLEGHYFTVSRAKATAVVSDNVLTFNDKRHGAVKPGDDILIDHERVFVNGAPRHACNVTGIENETK